MQYSAYFQQDLNWKCSVLLSHSTRAAQRKIELEPITMFITDWFHDSFLNYSFYSLGYKMSEYDESYNFPQTLFWTSCFVA